MGEKPYHRKTIYLLSITGYGGFGAQCRIKLGAPVGLSMLFAIFENLILVITSKLLQ